MEQDIGVRYKFNQTSRKERQIVFPDTYCVKVPHVALDMAVGVKSYSRVVVHSPISDRDLLIWFRRGAHGYKNNQKD